MRYFLSLALAAALFAQEKAPAPVAVEAAIIPVKTLTGQQFDRLARMLNVFSSTPNVRYNADDRLRVILVYAPQDVIAQMRKVVEQLDQPGSAAATGENIEITVAFLRASNTPEPDAAPMPPEMEAVAKQIRAVTPFKGVQLWDVVPLRSQEGGDSAASFRLLGTTPVKDHFATGRIRTRVEAVVRKDGSRYVRFGAFNVDLKVPLMSGTGVSFNDFGLSTTGDFKEGQKTVLGKVTNLSADTALFAVVSVKVLD